MNKLVISLLFATWGFGSFAQSGEWCATTKASAKLQSKQGDYFNTLHQGLINVAGKPANSESKKATIIVPTVVHIIHDNGIGNISDEQIFSALEVLNIDYNRANADTVETRGTANAPFKQIAAGMDIEFRLATIDPAGNCTNGIVRVNAPHLTYDAGEDCKYAANGGSSAWPKENYFNIWVVNTIDSEGASGIIAGYAYYPYGAENNDGYGILMNNSFMGTIGTADYGDGRVLTHEMGHALGLPHIFDQGMNPVDGCHVDDCYQYGDYSCDTPPQKEPNWGCSPTWNSCNEIPTNDPFGFDAMDQIENYMSYNSCQNMFSQDQVNVMINNTTDILFLNELTSAANITATGALLPHVFCKAEFEAYKRVICSQTTVQFQDYSFTDPTTWSWSVAPGTEGVDYLFVNGSSSISQFPEITFVTPGYYDITLTASDGTTVNTETKSDYIQVLPNDSDLPYWEGFESYSALSQTDKWAVRNPGGNAEFQIVNGVAHSGAKCVKLANYLQPIGNTDELLSSPIDLSTVDPVTEDVTLSFRYAYRKRSASNDEWLKVFVTSNCGDTWVQRKTIHGDVLSDQTYPASWTPSGVNDWTTVHMTNVTSSYFTENFRCKFRFESDGGNNFYLDDINIYKGAPSDVLINTIEEEVINMDELSLYPNPAIDEINVRFGLSNAALVELKITDISGKLIRKIGLAGQAGNNVVMIDTHTLSSGTYMLEFHAANSTQYLRFVKP